MERVVIYGAGNVGKSLYFYLRKQKDYECLFFVDGNKNKEGGVFEGLPIKSPDILEELKDIQVIIASIYWREILEKIKGIDGIKISVYKPKMADVLLSDAKGIEEVQERDDFDVVRKQLGKRTIDLGAFFQDYQQIKCKELTFLPGGSSVLNYAFLKTLAIKYNCRNYLEIGTYIGESINVLSDCCEKLYSITAPEDGEFSMDEYCKKRELPNYSERLAYSDKIRHFYCDSKVFDYSKIQDSVDLYFIDGDHTYNGVYADTRNIFEVRNGKSIVVWHDFRKSTFQYNQEVVSAVKDILGDDFRNVFVTNGNLCGVYLPNDYIQDFKLKELKYERCADLYTYDVILENCQIK